MGFLNGDKFVLRVSLGYVPGSDDEWAFLRTLFEQVSQGLYAATAGAHSIGVVFFCEASSGTAIADVIVPDMSVIRESPGARLWIPGHAIQYGRHNLADVTLLVHEFGHYLYGVYDEYNGPPPMMGALPLDGLMCVGDATKHACLMEDYSDTSDTAWVDAYGIPYGDWNAFWPAFLGGALLHQGSVTQFCFSANHGSGTSMGFHPGLLTYQEATNHESCWETMADDGKHGGIPYNLAAPAADPSTVVLGAPKPVKFVEVIPADRYVLLLDRSGSMAGNKLAELKLGAHFWIDYVDAPEELGIVSFANMPSLDAAVSEVGAGVGIANWRMNLHNAVDALTAGGSTAIGDALGFALGEITAGGITGNMVIVLFTDGLENAGAQSIATILPDLVSSGVRIQVIGIGDDQAALVLDSLAQTTGGAFTGIPAAVLALSAQGMISDLMMAIAAQSRANSAMTCFEEVSPVQLAADAQPFDWTGAPVSGTASLDFPVEISAGSTQATIGLAWLDSSLAFDVQVLDPDGELVVQGAQVRRVHGARPYSFVVVRSPKPGIWRVRIASGTFADARFRVFGFEVNPRIQLTIDSTVELTSLGAQVRVVARMQIPESVPHASVHAWLGAAPGGWSLLSLAESGNSRDSHADAPRYSAVFPIDPDVPAVHLLGVDVLVGKGWLEIEHVSRRPRPPDTKPDAKTLHIDVPRIKRRMLVGVVTGPRHSFPDGSSPGHNTKPASIPANQRALLDQWKKKHAKS